MKTILALAAVATIAVGSVGDAHARNNGAVAAGILGGLAAGAIIGGAIAGSQPGYAAAPGYRAYPAYAEPGPVDCPGGYWARRPRFDPYGNFMGYSRPRYFCP
jgi:hypothetical protein